MPGEASISPPHQPAHAPTTPSAFPLDDFFLSAHGDQPTCEPCDAATVMTNLVVPLVVGIVVVAIAASCIHPATWRRYVTMGEWFQIQEGILLALQAKGNLFFTLGQTVSLAFLFCREIRLYSK